MSTCPITSCSKSGRKPRIARSGPTTIDLVTMPIRNQLDASCYFDPSDMLHSHDYLLLIFRLAYRLPVGIHLYPVINPLLECLHLARVPNSVGTTTHLFLLAVDNGSNIALFGIIVLESLERNVANKRDEMRSLPCPSVKSMVKGRLLGSGVFELRRVVQVEEDGDKGG